MSDGQLFPCDVYSIPDSTLIYLAQSLSSPKRRRHVSCLQIPLSDVKIIKEDFHGYPKDPLLSVVLLMSRYRGGL
jgi:hypothetical protein